MIKHLYIIGNGFDLHHKVNSSYKNFQDWMYQNNSDVIQKIDEIYGICDDEWWSDFENQLASLDVIRYSEEIAFENQPNLASDHCDRMWSDAQIEVENQLEELYSELRTCFHKWIEQLTPPSTSRQVKLIIQDSKFINFNYTKTLENLYGIYPHQILHLHGCVDKDEDFVLGHGKSYEELDSLNTEKIPVPPKDLDEYELNLFYEEQAKSHELHVQLARQAAISGVASQKKPVNDIINKNESFFNSLCDISHIHVYGLSLSEVDIPYLKHILAIVGSAKWEFSDYNNLNHNKINYFCNTNNIQDCDIINLEDIIDTSQLKIPFPELK